MRIVALSDTHGQHAGVLVPEGDVLVFAGDFMTDGFRGSEVRSFAAWFKAQPHQHKILVAGNHDRLLESHRVLYLPQFEGVIYLQNQGVEIDGLHFWGGPYTPEFMNWAFNYPREEIHRFWDAIPDDTDVLVTHGPPFHYLDKENLSDGHVGDSALLDRLAVLQPKVNIFGHIHGGYGSATFGKTRLFNVSICNPRYNPVNPVTVIEL